MHFETNGVRSHINHRVCDIWVSLGLSSGECTLFILRKRNTEGEINNSIFVTVSTVKKQEVCSGTSTSYLKADISK